MVTARFTPWNGLPPEARQAGFEQDHQLLYLARAAYAGGLHLGKIRADWHRAAIPHGGQEVWADGVEVWTHRLSDASGGVWNVPSGSPGDAVVCGHEADGTPLYAARAYHDGGLHLGKWRADWTAAAIPYGGQELWVSRFSVLHPGQYIDGDPAFEWQRRP
ncbi:DM9 repeat-containing protein [Streptosporangium saharense]|uniref:DM9 repeat-containing protein n=1 Tax=Streptosporangium saharense TaxID=1706840 RepID=UPI003446357A